MGENNNVVAKRDCLLGYTQMKPKIELGHLESTDGDICLMLQRDAYSITLCDHVLSIRSIHLL